MKILLFVLSLLAFPCLVAAETVDVPITECVGLVDDAQSFCYASDNYAWISNATSGSDWWRGRIIFNSSLIDDSIPAGAVITSCILNFYTAAPQSPITWDVPVVVRLSSLVQYDPEGISCGWVEGTSGNSNYPSWTYRASGSSWSGASSCDETTVYDTDTLTDAENTLYSMTIPAAWATARRAAPDGYGGLLLVSKENITGSNSTVRAIYSDDAASLTPYLEITYEDLTAANIDYLHTDYSGELDSFWVAAEVFASTGADSIAFAVSTSGYPDSTSIIEVAWPMLSPWASGYIGGISAADGDSVYLSAWSRDNSEDEWGPRVTASMKLHENYIVIPCNASFPVTINQATGTYYHSQGNGATDFDTVVIGGTRIETGGSALAFATNTHHFLLWGGANGGRDSIFAGIDSAQQGPTAVSIGQRTATGTAGGNAFKFSDIVARVIPNHYSTVFWYQDSMYMPWQLDTLYCTPDSVVVWDSAFQANDVNEQDRAAVFSLGYKNYDIELNKVDAYITGYCYNAQVGQTVSGAWWGLTIDSSVIENNIQAYASRGPYCAMCVNGANASIDTLEAEGVNALTSFGNKYLVHGWGGVMARPYSSIIGDTFEIDGGNARWLDASGGAEGGHANMHCIFATDDVRGLEIANCIMTAGSLKKGGRGIEMEDADGTATYPWYIHHNNIDVHEGPDSYFGTSYQPSGCKVRNGSQYGHFDSNTVILTGDTDHDDSDVSPWNNSYHNNGHAFIYQQETFGTCTPGSGYNLTFIGNTFIRRDRGSSGAATIQAVEFDKCVCNDLTTTWSDNTIVTDSLAYRFGQFDGEADSIRIYGDSIVFVDTVYGHALAAVGYLASYSGDDERFYDVKTCVDDGNSVTCTTCEDGQSNIVFSTSFDDDAAFYYTMVVSVEDTLGNPVENARVRITNGYGVGVSVDSTNINGIDSVIVKTAQYFRTTADSTSFNDFTISAILDADSVSMDTCTVTCLNKTFTLTLSGAQGESAPVVKYLRGVKRP